MAITDNLVTERQAKKKACPFRQSGQPLVAIDGFDTIACVASNCMRWRFRDIEAIDDDGRKRKLGHCGGIEP